MQLLCDLHTHSVFSDGSCTPCEIIEEAENKNLKAVALCDHNTVNGLSMFMKAAENKKLNAVCGVELSTDYGKKQLHILALFVNEKNFQQVTDFVSALAKRKIESNLQLERNLRKGGYNISLENIINKTANGQVNRANFASELLEKGYVNSIDEAFKTLLNEKYGFYKPPKRLDVFESIDFIRSIHSVPVLAHPFLNLEEKELYEFLPKAKDSGLLAIETYYSLFGKDLTEKAETLAQRFSLLKSGGSDYHGKIKPNIFLGSGKGDLKVPFQVYTDLLEVSKNI